MTRLLNALLLAAAYLALLTECRLHHRHGTVPGCSRCGPGLYVVRPCDPHHQRDRECAPCPPGTYSPHHSYAGRCYPCARCGEGLYVAHSCTLLRDTVCDSCHTFKGPHNGDFRARCGLADSASTGVAVQDNSTTENSHPSGSGQRPNPAEMWHRTPTQTESEWERRDLSESSDGQVYKTQTSSRSAPSSSRAMILTVLLVSAAGSFVFFLGLAALALTRYRSSITKKVHQGQWYGAVQTVEPVML